MRRWSSRVFALSGLTMAGALLLAAATGAADDTARILRARIAGTSDLSAAAGGERIGVLLPGADVRILEQQGDWARVEIIGWVPAGAVVAADIPPSGTAAPALPPAAPSEPPVTATARETRAGSLTGTLYVAGPRGRTLVGANTGIILLKDPALARQALEGIRAECERLRSGIVEDAARLKRQADQALKTIENTTRAFEAYDEAKRARERKMRELRRHDETCATQESEASSPLVQARGLTSSDGRFRFEHVPAGRYLLVTSFEAENQRHAWEVETEVAAGGTVDLPLTEANRLSVTDVPTYK